MYTRTGPKALPRTSYPFFRSNPSRKHWRGEHEAESHRRLSASFLFAG